MGTLILPGSGLVYLDASAIIDSMHDDSVSLRQMLDHAREAVEFTRDRSRQDIENDRLLSLALVRLCQIIGEAARRVSAAKQHQHPEIRWPQIISFRSHGYDTIDYNILWRILTTAVPALILALEELVP